MLIFFWVWALILIVRVYDDVIELRMLPISSSEEESLRIM